MFIQPIDMIKVTIQLKSEEIANANKALRAQGKPLESGNISFAHTAREIMAEGGLGAFYRGLSAALLRQVFYTTTRLGIYKTVFAEVSRRNKEKGRSTNKVIQRSCPSRRRLGAQPSPASSAAWWETPLTLSWYECRPTSGCPWRSAGTTLGL